MRRIALILVLLAFVFAGTGCCIECCDFMHPVPCPSKPTCCPPCNERPDYSERGNYP